MSRTQDPRYTDPATNTRHFPPPTANISSSRPTTATSNPIASRMAGRHVVVSARRSMSTAVRSALYSRQVVGVCCSRVTSRATTQGSFSYGGQRARRAGHRRVRECRLLPSTAGLTLRSLSMMLFSADSEIDRIGRGLIDRSLPKTEWTHAAHFAAAFWLLRRPENHYHRLTEFRTCVACGATGRSTARGIEQKTCQRLRSLRLAAHILVQA